MTRPPPVWQAILWVERFLPAARSFDDRTRDGERNRWWLLAAFLPMMLVNLVSVARDRADLAMAWPVWRTVVLDALLVAGGACLIAIIAAGLVGWRQARRRPHA